MFILFASLLTLLGLFFLLQPLLQTMTQSSQSKRDQLNQAIYHSKVDELSADLDKGLLDEEEYELALQDLQQTLVTDITGEQYQPAQTKRMSGIAIFIAVSVPLSAFGLYQNLSTFETESETQERLIATQTQSMEAAMQSLRQSLQDNPQDLDGWKMLGQSYTTLEQYEQAKDVYLTALQHFNNSDPDLLVLAAEASAFANEELFTDYELNLLARALSIKPQHERALWYAGYASFLNQKYADSVTHWTKLLRLVPDSRPEVKTSLSQFLNDARDRAGMETLIVADRVESNQREITVNVALDDSLHTQISANETLFIYAKAATGPPMPLSLVRLSAGDLPVTVRLTKELAMIPDMNLDSFPQVVVLARISKSGQAISQAGDLISAPQLVDFERAAQAEITLLINQVYN